MAKIAKATLRLPNEADSLRQGALALAAVSLIFGSVQLIAPRWFARTFGLPIADDPAGAIPIRSIGARDAVIGLGIWSAVTHGGTIAPWLLARTLAEAGDSVSLALAWLHGSRSPRLAVTSVFAALTTAAEVTLYRVAKRR